MEAPCEARWWGATEQHSGIFSSKAALHQTAFPASPWGSCRLPPTEEVFAILPLACIKFCSQNFMQAKMWSLSLHQAFPSGGRWTKRSFGRMRGAAHFFDWKISATFFNQGAVSSSKSHSVNASFSFPFPPRPPLPKHSRPYSFFVVISRLSSLRLFPSASIPVFHPTPLFSKNISPRNPFAPNRCFRRKHNYYLITFPKTPFIVPPFFILNANICSFFYSITYKTCQHIAIFRKFFHFFYRLF